MQFCVKLAGLAKPTSNNILIRNDLGIYGLFVATCLTVTMVQSNVIIIGAGASGIAAATRLLQKGILNVTILEAENRIGGRVYTTPFGDNVVDLGAQWCHGEKHNAVYELAAPLNLLEHSIYDYNHTTFVESAGRIIPNRWTDGLVETLQYIMYDGDGDMARYDGSVGEYIIRKYEEKTKDSNVDPMIRELVLNWFKQFEMSIDGSDDWLETSAKKYNDYWDCSGDKLLHWKGRGYGTILDVLMKKIPDPSKKIPFEDHILLNKEVNNINWNNSTDTVTVECQDGSKYTANHVIVTASLGVLKDRHKTLFNPELPAYKQNAISGLGIGTVDKIILKFPNRWWGDEFGFSFVWNEHDKKDIAELFSGPEETNRWLTDVFGFYSIDEQPNLLLGWVVGESAHQMELLPQEEVKAKIVQLLKIFLGGKYKIPEPEQLISSKWYSNPHFRGSYCHQTVKGAEMNVSPRDLARPVKNDIGKEVLLFAGEATHEHYYSTVHGAIQSGWREADRIIRICNTEEKKMKVVIVGAGIAGLAAAMTFCEVGLGADIVVLEAQDQPGGRIRTVEIDGCAIEQGAQWMHGDGNPMYQLAHDNDLISETASEEGKGIYIREDGLVFDEFLVSKINFVIGEILEKCETFFCDDNKAVPESVEAFMRSEFDKYLKTDSDDSYDDAIDMKRELFDWHLRFQIIDNSCLDLNKLSAKFWGSYSCSDVNGQAHLNLKQGYKSLIDTMCSKIPEDCVRLNHKVVKIDYSEDGPVQVSCKNGKTFLTDFVLVTTSLGVLKAMHKTMFKPRLPKLMQKTIKEMGFDGINKIFLLFNEKWWEEEGFQIIWRLNKDQEFEYPTWMRYLSGFDEVASQPNMLLGWVGGYGAKLVEEVDEELVGKQCIDLLRHFLKICDIPYPVKTIRTCWLSNPYIRGAYSYTTSACDAECLGASQLCEPVCGVTDGQPKLFLAGEACHSTYFSTTHGAYESGEAQAKKILTLL